MPKKTQRKVRLTNKAKPSTYRLLKLAKKILVRTSKITGVSETRLLELSVISKYGSAMEKGQ